MKGALAHKLITIFTWEAPPKGNPQGVSSMVIVSFLEYSWETPPKGYSLGVSRKVTDSCVHYCY